MNNENYFPIEFDESGSSFTIYNSGTAPAPCKVTIIPKVDMMRLEITGLSEAAINMNGIKARDVVEIDGENNTVKINDIPAFDKYNAWEFPRLLPGNNSITISNGVQAAVQIEYNARYI